MDPKGRLWELVAGPEGESVFDSEAEREAAWHYHREQLMERRGSRTGDRPWGHWVYDLQVEEPATYLEKVLLLEKRGAVGTTRVRTRSGRIGGKPLGFTSAS